MSGNNKKTLLAIAFLAGYPLTLPAVDRFTAPPLTPLAEDGIHDPTNEAILTLQDPKRSMAEFPKDRRDEVNWVEALNLGVIQPRKTNTGRAEDGDVMPELDLDIIMNTTGEMPHVRFPHLAHTRWLACSNCHPDIFKAEDNGNPINMTKILRGEFCGRCHDKVSFSLWICERCHSVPHKNSPPAWWDTKK
ncbi:MAG: hypothetical protein FD165_185 [Gammaproteobacteria bacterium]|nr:MAG: hypothetical protein FD165_185 [Gammaproteobacteria bacterium]TND06763.1 MAG: hypothetical protein FD120_495 [Gammaproteobacteria bacterium]